MATVKKYKYKGIEIKIEVYEDGFFHGYALDVLSTSNKEIDRNNSNGYPTMARVIKDIETKVDEFLSITPKTYEELADAITATLVWDGYESAKADEFIIKTLIQNFIKTQK
jgi:succinylarginine dihydrolase